VAVLLLLQVVRGNDFSVPSLALLILLHAAYAVGLAPGLARANVQLQFFQDVATIVALCGIGQFLLQYIAPYEYAFPIETKFPPAMVIDRFNYLNPLYFGSLRFKSNGLFMLEPASFSQLCAVAMVAEYVYFRRVWRLAALAGGIVVSYSGTGVIVLAVAVPILIAAQRRFDLLFLLIGGAAVAYLGFDALQLDIFTRRIAEFSSPESSGFARYVGGFYLFAQYLWPDAGNALFGLGAGSAYGYGLKATYATSELSWVKMIFEFGLVGGGLYFAFMFRCIFGARQLALGAALAMAFLQNGALVPAVHALILALLVWPAPEPARTADRLQNPRAAHAAA
jgi:hypothetical protein